MINDKHTLPRPEFPNPQMKRDIWENLNGEWEFLKDPAISGRERKVYNDESFPQRITVPFCMESALSGIGDTDFCECVWYRREIEISNDWLTDNRRVLLHIGACDYRADVYVNGAHIGYHLGGSVSFSFDITEALTVGKNVIVISAEDRTRSGDQPLGKQCREFQSHGCEYTRTTGIWQTVWLENVPHAYVRSLRLIPNVENSSLGIVAEVVGSSGLPLTATAYWNDAEVGSATVTATVGENAFNLPLSELHLWELGRGGLYDLTITLGDDVLHSYFGMRTLSLDDTAIVINGKKVFQRLVLDQGFYPDGIWTAPTEQALIDDIERSIACGFNGARLHQKVFEPLFLYHCDRLGYMVWGEHGNWGLDLTRGSAWKGFVPEWLEIVKRDQNHPAIIGWCPFNETSYRYYRQDPDLIVSTVKLTKMLDPTRPVIDTSGWTHVEGATDIMDWHDYDQNPETFRQRYVDAANGIPVPVKRREWATFPIIPRFISEYGGIKWDVNSGNGNAWGYGNAPTTEEEFIERFRGLAEALLFNPFITGFCYTQLTDVEQEVNGLYTYDRQAKFAPSVFREVLSQKAAVEE